MNKFCINIGGIYKPERNNDNDFLETYAEQLESRKRSIALGDFNYDILKSNKATRNYKRAIQESGYKIINKVDKTYCTRQTLNSQTIIDHVCTNLQNDKFHFAVINSAMSDHKHLYLELYKYKPQKPKKTLYEAIDYNMLSKSIDFDFPNVIISMKK